MVYRFDKIIDRKNTNSLKWDGCKRVFGSDDLLPMWVADSDWPAPQVVIEAINKRVSHGIFGYTEPGEALDDVVMDWVRSRYGWNIKAEWLVYISGVVPAINVALKAYTGIGGNIILQPPVYYPFFSSVNKSGAYLIENQLIFTDNTYKMNLMDLKEKLIDMEQNNIKELSYKDSLELNTDINDEGKNQLKSNKIANILILCSPHNPVGRVWSEKELRQLGQLCIEHELLIVSDEIHSDLVYSTNKHTPMASISNDIAQQTITMIAPSKTFNLAGLNTAVTIIPNKQLRRQFTEAMKDFVPGGNIIGYTAMKAAYSQGAEWLDYQLLYLEKNREFVINYISKNIPGIEAIRPEGTYLLWLDCRGLGLNNKQLERFMVEKARVGLDVGTWFGSGGEGFMRLNMACPRIFLEEGLQRIKGAVKILRNKQ